MRGWPTCALPPSHEPRCKRRGSRLLRQRGGSAIAPLCRFQLAPELPLPHLNVGARARARQNQALIPDLTDSPARGQPLACQPGKALRAVQQTLRLADEISHTIREFHLPPTRGAAKHAA